MSAPRRPEPDAGSSLALRLCLAGPSPALAPPGRAETYLEGAPPKAITGRYVKDFNILRAHAVILARFAHRRARLPEYRARLAALRARERGEPLRAIDYMKLKDDIARLEAKIRRVEADADAKSYTKQAEPLIEAYRSLGVLIRTVSAGEAGPAPEDPRGRERIVIIERYLRLAAQWIRVDVVRENPDRDRCEACGEAYDDAHVETRGTLSCLGCGREKPHLVASSQSKESTKTSASQRNDYDDRENFLKAFYRYQGLQPKQIPPALYAALDRHFRPKSDAAGALGPDLRGAAVRALPLQVDGRRGGTTHDMLYAALAETGFSDFYEDANLIGHEYWGWELPKVLHLKDIIMEDYRQTQNVYRTIPKDRSSSLGVPYRLFKHLQLRGWPCSMSEFRIAENRESLDEQENLWRMMCEGANNPSIYYISSLG